MNEVFKSLKTSILVLLSESFFQAIVYNKFLYQKSILPFSDKALHLWSENVSVKSELGMNLALIADMKSQCFNSVSIFLLVLG